MVPCGAFFIIVMCVGLGQAEVKRCGRDFTVIN